ncbi:hypothetical protein BBP40_006736 [Aspergillus hancockii]|nr:hypothetical protein BBP40_006736 [Aspergillus hancockii]
MTDFPPCGLTVACNRSKFFDGILNSNPIFHTSSTPVYSNPGFQILGTGGLYSSPNYMTTVAWAILNSTLLRPSLTRRCNRLIDIYTKSGDLGMYSTMIALSPDHGIGYTILAAGESTTATVALIADLTAKFIIPAV